MSREKRPKFDLASRQNIDLRETAVRQIRFASDARDRPPKRPDLPGTRGDTRTKASNVQRLVLQRDLAVGMKKPSPEPSRADVLGIDRPDPNEAQIEAILVSLDATQLTALLKRVETVRAEKLADAKRNLIAKYRAEAAALGLDFDEITRPLATAVKKPTPTTTLPAGWQEAVIDCLKKNEGRATSNTLHRAVWPQGGSGMGSGTKLKAALSELIADGVLLLLRPGNATGKAIYGLASMIEAPDQEDAA